MRLGKSFSRYEIITAVMLIIDCYLMIDRKNQAIGGSKHRTWSIATYWKSYSQVDPPMESTQNLLHRGKLS